MNEPVDIKAWIGRQEVAEDLLTPELVRRFNATLGQDTNPTDAIAPLGIHWCLAPAAVSAPRLGEDGHPRLGGFLPPVPLPRRMWAGGSLDYHTAFHIGDTVTRRSTITAIADKSGKSGRLCFVTVQHEFTTPRGPALSEEQTIVYRQPSQAPRAVLVAPQPAPWLSADPVMLFRFSALTFNGHRIHYDAPYAIHVENYPGLVVHAPLQAALLLQQAGKRGPVAQFSFRGLQPLFAGEPFQLAEDGATIAVVRANGDTTTSASVQWQ